jgi:ParB family chromosome partitioning protein
MSNFFNNAVFWVEVDRIKANPFQPRRDFDESKLRELADSIKMYGVLQPLVVTRQEIAREDGSFTSEYELISGERRLRASKIAGLAQVPVLIRSNEQSDREKLEIAIIENLQREDLSVVDRARAFQRLIDEFGLKHAEIGQKLGRSREYVSNTVRILNLPEDMLKAVGEGKVTEGHTRPLLMLIDRPDEQRTLFQDIMLRRITVREAEGISRRIAYDRARKVDQLVDPEMYELERKFKEMLGTRVRIERKDVGGKLSIDFFTADDLRAILDIIENNKRPAEILVRQAAVGGAAVSAGEPAALDDRTATEKDIDENTDLYSIKNFSV